MLKPLFEPNYIDIFHKVESVSQKIPAGTILMKDSQKKDVVKVSDGTSFWGILSQDVYPHYAGRFNLPSSSHEAYEGDYIGIYHNGMFETDQFEEGDYIPGESLFVSSSGKFTTEPKKGYVSFELLKPLAVGDKISVVGVDIVAYDGDTEGGSHGIDVSVMNTVELQAQAIGNMDFGSFDVSTSGSIIIITQIVAGKGKITEPELVPYAGENHGEINNVTFFVNDNSESAIQLGRVVKSSENTIVVKLD